MRLKGKRERERESERERARDRGSMSIIAEDKIHKEEKSAKEKGFKYYLKCTK